MKINFKKLTPNAVTPTYAHEGDGALDITATRKYFDEKGNRCYGTGLALEIPEDYVGLLLPRSSNSKKDLILTNSVGLIDATYRGEITFKFRSQLSAYVDEYEIGERVGQLLIIPRPHVELVEMDELSDTDRGNGGYGSTGK